MRRNYTVAGLVALTLLVADLVTKRWASMTFTAQPVDVIGSFLQFRYVENTGAAFSMFQNAGPLFGIAAIAAIVVVLWFLHKAPGMWEVVGLGFVLAGAAGNLVDRIARGPGILDGAVIDWVNLWIIPTFNLADASITIAVVLLLIGSWVTD